jgi:hypothetical protein
MITWAILLRYALVVDAGTTQSSIMAYAWDDAIDPPVISEFTDPDITLPQRTSTPLANAIRDSNAIRDIFSILLAWGKATIPGESQSQTEFFVLGTSGMRQLESETQTSIMTNVHNYLVTDGTFVSKPEHCKVLTVNEEAAFHWAAVNLLMGLIGGTTKPVLSIGSVNAVFVAEYDTFTDDLKPWRQELKLHGTSHFLFVGPMLNLGIDEAISSHVVELASTSGRASVNSPCFNNGHTRTVEQITLSGAGNYDKCYESLSGSLDIPDCDHSACLFSGIPRPDIKTVVGLDIPYYTREFFGLPEDASIGEYEAKGAELCRMAIDEAALAYPKGGTYLPVYCFYTAYIANFFKRGLGLSSDSRPLIVQKWDNQTISFTIGAVLSMLYPPDYQTGLTTAEIGAIVVLSLIFLVLIIALIIRCCVNSRRAKKEQEEIKESLLNDWDGDGVTDEAIGAPTEENDEGLNILVPQENAPDAVVGEGLTKMGEVTLNV